MNEQLWEKAVEYHGHSCGGLALGVRLGEEARQIFGHQAKIHCRTAKRSCVTDGIIVALGIEETLERMETDSSAAGYIFYEEGDEEGWEFVMNNIDLMSLGMQETAILTCNRDFLFRLSPCDVD